MANSILTIDMITRKALEILENNLVLTRNVNRQYDDSFAVEGAKIGSTLRIRLPDRALVTDGAALQVQDDNFTLLDGQFRQCPCDLLRPVLSNQNVWRAAGVKVLCEHSTFHINLTIRLSMSSTQVASGPIYHTTEQISFEIAPNPAFVRRKRDEDVLQTILGDLPVADQRAGHRGHTHRVRFLVN